MITTTAATADPEIIDAPVWHLTPDEYAATVEKFAKINERAARRGFTGRLDVTGERIERTTKNDLGFEVTEIVIRTTITGEAPRYADTEFLATLTWDTEAGLITRPAPGVTTLDRTGLIEGQCNYCRTSRDRRLTYLVRRAGVQFQVGSTCIKDFLGWSGTPVFLSASEAGDEIDSIVGGGAYGERRYSVETIFAVAWAAVQAFGYVKANDYSATPTKEIVRAALDPVTPRDRELTEALRPYVAEAGVQAAKIRNWVVSEMAGDSEYTQNLRAVAGVPTASTRNIGLLASAPQTWARAMERDLQRKQAADELINEFYPTTEGAKITIDVKIKSIRYVDGTYGTSTVYTLVSRDGYVFTWFASRSAFGTETTDEYFKITATVKGFETFRTYRRTKITRAKKA